MAGELRTLETRLRAVPTARAFATLLALAFFALVLFAGIAAAWRIAHLEHRRDLAVSSRTDPAAFAGHAAGAFRRFRTMMGAGDRFALVFGAATSVDDAGFYRLAALSYLYPAIAVTKPAEADWVIVVGEPSRDLRARFAPTGSVDGFWLGHRRT